MIEAKRGATEYYPYAFTRMFGIANIFVRRLLPHSDKDPPGMNVVRLDQMRKSLLQDVLVPAFFNAMDIAETCCRSVGSSLEETFGWVHDGKSIAGILSSEFIAILKDEPQDALTKEAAQFAKLRLLISDFDKLREPFRWKRDLKSAPGSGGD
jgi:hypothetical protein